MAVIFVSLGRSKCLRGYVGRKFWEVREVKIFIGRMGRQIWEVIDVGKFWRFGRSQNLGGREVWKVGLIGRMLPPV
jgi:hypothetical protein